MKASVIHTYIVYTLSQARLSQAALAKVCNCSPAMINYVITGRKQSPKIQHSIARFLGFSGWDQLTAAAYQFQSVVQASAYSTREASNA